MKKIIILVALIAALGTTDTQAQYRRGETVWGALENDHTVYRDERGEYRWEMRERRVWVPEYRTGGIFGIGRRTIPGHYEMRRERAKVYLRQNRQNGKKPHPHGMPPGQRKKMGNAGYDPRYEGRRDERYEDRRYEDRDERYQSKGKSKRADY